MRGHPLDRFFMVSYTVALMGPSEGLERKL